MRARHARFTRPHTRGSTLSQLCDVPSSAVGSARGDSASMKRTSPETRPVPRRARIARLPELRSGVLCAFCPEGVDPRRAGAKDDGRANAGWRSKVQLIGTQQKRRAGWRSKRTQPHRFAGYSEHDRITCKDTTSQRRCGRMPAVAPVKYEEERQSGSPVFIPAARLGLTFTSVRSADPTWLQRVYHAAKKPSFYGIRCFPLNSCP